MIVKKYNRSVILILLMLLMILMLSMLLQVGGSTVVHAQVVGGGSSPLKLGIGGGFIVTTNIRRDNNLDGNSSKYVTNWLPMASFSWGRLTVRGPALFLSLWQEWWMGLSLKLSVMGHDYRAEGMFRRKYSYCMGSELRLIFLRLSFQQDIQNYSNGRQYAINLGHHWNVVDGLMLNLGAQVEYYEKKYVDYYFGVRSEEARVDRPQYLGRGSWNYGPSTGLIWRLGKGTNISLNYRYRLYGRAITESPTVRTNKEHSYSLFMSTEII
ncbi:MAG: TonB-dependent receptor [Oligoflexia bacterium]|nr:TonB-dependent receptor [Oligoflexia bacterium]